MSRYSTSVNHNSFHGLVEQCTIEETRAEEEILILGRSCLKPANMPYMCKQHFWYYIIKLNSSMDVEVNLSRDA